MEHNIKKKFYISDIKYLKIIYKNKEKNNYNLTSCLFSFCYWQVKG